MLFSVTKAIPQLVTIRVVRRDLHSETPGKQLRNLAKGNRIQHLLLSKQS